jgi:microcin C transport system substrate-binding protein
MKNFSGKRFAVLTFLLLTLLLPASAATAGTWYPKDDESGRPDPLASPDAQKGGEVTTFGGQYPKSLNYYLDSNVLSAEVFGYMFETLLSMHPVTLAYQPGLAEQWHISDDKRTFTFHLDPDARWSDGTPVTARDVQWTYDMIMDPGHMTGPHKISMERFHRPEIMDSKTIRFTAKKVHWKNLQAAGGFHVLCRHAYKDRDFNKVNFQFPVVSGPYRPGAMEEGRYIKIKRRGDWWDADAAANQGKFNFDTIKYRFFAERSNAFEAFKKGRIDIFPVYTSRIWINETSGEPFFNNYIIKQKVHNHQPIGFQGFAMNMRRAPFDDLRVRKAMAYLLDRRKMNRTLMYNQYFLHRSYYEDLYSPAHPCPNPLIEMNKEKARSLLKAAGWRVNPDTGFLEKSGRRLSFQFLSRNASSDKFLSIYAEDLKDVGIEMKIDRKDWAAWARDMEEYNFQMTWAAWSAGVFKDPESMWASSEAERKGGNNITGFTNERVDALIEKQKTLFDVEKRNAICREIDQIIYDDFPYALLWNIDYTRLLYWNKFGMPPTVLSKYGNEASALVYWWLDPDARSLLKDAQKHHTPLPPQPAEVHFDKVFKP